MSGSRFVANLLIVAVGLFGFVTGTFLFDVPELPAEEPTAPAPQNQSPGSPRVIPLIPTIDGEFLPPPAKLGGAVSSNAPSNPQVSQRVVRPRSVPEAILGMPDDVGFGVPITFRGVIPAHTRDRIAEMGVWYADFRSAALQVGRAARW